MYFYNEYLISCDCVSSHVVYAVDEESAVKNAIGLGLLDDVVPNKQGNYIIEIHLLKRHVSVKKDEAEKIYNEENTG